MADPRSPVAVGEIVGGKYRVERVLGAGGMGVVVAATHVDLGQAVALKFLVSQALAGPENVERFLREARAAVRLKSEHVARVYDVGRDADRPYMVLELLDGLDLAKLVKKSGPPPIPDAVEYVVQACEALVEAHALGIVHRDLKPQNLFVTKKLNGMPLVKVLDFGISKAIGPSAVGQMALTDSNAIMGSPLYMAPEQMRAARLADVRSDIWALGVILYELLGGRVPFDGETVTEVCLRVVNEAPRPLTELRPDLDPRLVAAVMRCLEKDPNARFQNCAQLAAAIEPFARSAQNGMPSRAWRSLEDTQDPRAFATSDDTGPSTAVTMPEKRLAEALGATDVSWGQATPPPPPPSGKAKVASSAFRRGLAAGAVSTLAAAAVAAAFAFAPSKPSEPPARAASAPPEPPPAVVSAVVPAPSPEPVAEPAAVTSSSPARPASPATTTSARRPAPAKTAASTTAPPPSSPPAPAATTAPNGAPILR